MGPLWTALGSVYRAVHARIGHKFTSRQKIGPYGPFELDGTFAFSDLAHWGGAHNAGFTHCVEASRGASCVIDAGAHVGFVTLPVSQVLAPGGRVLAIEPATENLRCLRRHLALNKSVAVDVVPALVGDVAAKKILFHERLEISGQNGLAIKKQNEKYVVVERDQVTIDDLCRERSLSPDVIKIDVEGAEIMVLKGARQTLATARPTIFLSVHPTEIGLLGGSIEELVALIDDLGYTCADLDGQPVTNFRLSEYLLRPRLSC